MRKRTQGKLCNVTPMLRDRVRTPDATARAEPLIVVPKCSAPVVADRAVPPCIALIRKPML